MADAAPRSVRFSILFIGTLALISLSVFFIFKWAQSAAFTERREKSFQNLQAMGRVVEEFTKAHNGQFPDTLEPLQEAFKNDPLKLVHPAWMDQPGYVLIPGVIRANDGDSAIVIYENVPEGRRKIGRQVLRANGQIEFLDDGAFEQRIREQRASFEKWQRQWVTLEIVPKPGK